MDLSPQEKKGISASVPKSLVKRLDKITHEAQWVHHTKLSRSELITHLCLQQLNANDTEDIVKQIEEGRKEEEKVTATT